MQRIPDAVTSIFHLDTKDERLAACLKGDSTEIVYSEKFGMGWCFGLQYARRGWVFARVKVYLDHTHCISETDTATVTVCLKDGSASEGPSFNSRTISIADFGHGPPALLGSFSPSRIIAHPYICITVTAKVDIVQAIADPLTGTASALRQSMNDGAFVDTKYYVMSRPRNGRSPAKTRVLYANNALLTQDVDAWQLGPLPHSLSSFVVLHIVTCLLLPSICPHLSYPSQSLLLCVHFLASITWWFVRRRPVLPMHKFFAAPPDGQTMFANTDCLLMEYQSESSLNRDIEKFDYDLDSDIDDDDEENENAKEEREGQRVVPSMASPYNLYGYSLGMAPVEFDSDVSDTASSSALSSDDDRDDISSTIYAAGLLPPGFISTDTLVPEPLPPPSLPTQRMVLVRNTAFTTWASYVYYCYTGQISFYPLKSKDPDSRHDKTSETLRCSPKSMYRLAVKLKHTRLEALAFQAIESSLSDSNILDEAFSKFTAQYSDIRKMEVELLLAFRSAPEVAVGLERIVEAVSQGEMPYARAMLHAFLARLAQLGAGGT
ncbi:hypothetical protein EDB19DRAFT_1671073 [Suillus lakei]|nr:hypothetical protein EDB19DRAFT_1671073 [Suillus lakei]